MKPLIYIAGPYTNPDPVVNTRTAIKLGDLVCDLGCAAIIPHLSIVRHLVAPRALDDWYQLDLDLLDHCDALLRFAGESTGADREVAYAHELTIPVFHTVDGMAGFQSWRRRWRPPLTSGPVTTTETSR